MKRISLLLIIICILLTGCGRYSKNAFIKNLDNNINKGEGYKLTGQLSVHNNDDNYNYKIDVFYNKKGYYRVILTNKMNNYSQIILKNKDGVYVLTPALNKSFRFNSDWPYHNSQIYLLDALLEDVRKDNKSTFIKRNNKYFVETKVSYPNNSRLAKQKIFISKNHKIEKIVVYQKDGIIAMEMVFNKINYSPKFNSNDFKLSSYEEKKEEIEMASFDDVIYPLVIPDGTKLVSEEKVDKEAGKRVIMNYEGEKSFLLVEESADVLDEFTVIPTMGEPYPLMDTLGVMTNNSLSWTSGGVDFYIVSDVMSQDEMIEIAQSITGIVSIK